ncbi:PKD domain-containing protein [Flaviramulus basaltis]|uniref:PKD domain-containing protein n=1 Tax=Flaviramulus basaltis TaxID=369401 RepID=A0A1K2INQ9_9FLAO|nr:PKD domain-containing protein [Flaviramulus basaltis]SFZ94084.1 PKD domain-containing protein [Flaviramulus basaltis]
MKNYKKYFQSLMVVTLLLTLFSSCTDDDTPSLNVVNPNAQFTFTISDENPYLVNFTSLITDRDSWSWDFGDGETSTVAHPTHTYAEVGEYIVTLTAIGELGSIPAEVQQGIIIKLYDPTATFSYLASTGDPLEIKFSTTAAYAKSYAWDFGDGNVSTEKSPTHIYDTEGNYTATLIVTGLDGTTPVEITQEVTVGVVLAKLEGTLIGHEGSWNDDPATYITAAVDGDLSTFVDGADAEGFVGYDFGEGVSLKLVKYAPREGDFFITRMVGGEIRGSNDPTILTDPSAATFNILYTITEAPAFELNQAVISIPETYRFIYYYSADGFCNISELEFYGEIGEPADFVAINVENSDFSLPATGKQSNWDNVPGWSSDSTATDSGVEEDGEGTNEWYAYRMSSDPSAYNLTDYVISDGKQFKINLDAWNGWNSSQIIVTLYYDTGDGIRNTLATQTFDLVIDPDNRVVSNFELIAPATTASVGANLGIMIDNVSTDGGDGWTSFDNVQLFAK